ncbi:hypothetical protein M8J76_008837 [Diaphorina citri]|nr:hypothetical protein M8J75_009797 [Diaphorina citri]KAI5740948.1 hypothetical protein M8J76_008837 [Diaphorina citri]
MPDFCQLKLKPILYMLFGFDGTRMSNLLVITGGRAILDVTCAPRHIPQSCLEWRSLRRGRTTQQNQPSGIYVVENELASPAQGVISTYLGRKDLAHKTQKGQSTSCVAKMNFFD